MKKLYAIAISLLFVIQINLNAQTLLASYPLVADGIDVTGNNNELTIAKAPFQNGGIYSNGVYYGSDTTGSHIRSPQITDFDFDDLRITIDFMIEEYPEFSNPIIMCGMSWRWMSAWMIEDKIALKVNNGSFYEVSDVVVSLNEWNTLSLTYNKVDAEAKLYLNGSIVLTIVVEDLTHGENGQIVNSDGGVGKTYKGYWRNMEVYNSSIISSVDNAILEDIRISSYGNEVQVNIPFDNNGVDLDVYDISGRKLGDYKLYQGRNNLNVPQGNNLIMLVFNDKNGNKSDRKFSLNN